MLFRLGVFVALVAANAYFVAAEFSMLTIDAALVDRLAEDGDRAALRLERLLAHLTYHLSGAQLGITLMSVLLGFVAEPTVARIVEPTVGNLVGDTGSAALSVAIALVIATVAHMVLGEQVPKYAALAKPSLALTLSPVIAAWGTVARPVITLSNNAANRVVRMLGREPRDDLDISHTLGELGVLVQASGEDGALDPEEVRLLTRSIRFVQKQVGQVMVPRVAVRGLLRDQSIADMVEVSLETGFSRFPVYAEDSDHVIGVVHVKSVAAVPRERRSATPVETITGPVLEVPEVCEVERLFFALRDRQMHMAIVIDEHGGTAGIVTLEDLLEEIVGDISDEFDAAESDTEWTRDRGAFVLPGSLHLDEVFDATGFVVPRGEYETLAGFVLDRLGRIPVGGESVDWDGWRLEVARVDRLRIGTVRLTPYGADDGREGPP